MITQPVSTNVITGFLGVGKTSLIKALLANKPYDEIWAVLINEFGEIGLDSHLLAANVSQQVVIKEVAGGCLCCAAGLPIQVAINQLLAKAKPHRLLIEPTGLGHTDNILALLQGEHYQQVISLNSSLCLVDARKIKDPAYRENEIFIKQLQCADIIVANKSSLYSSQDMSELQAYLMAIGADKATLVQDLGMAPPEHSNETWHKQPELFSQSLLIRVTQLLTQKTGRVTPKVKAALHGQEKVLKPASILARDSSLFSVFEPREPGVDAAYQAAFNDAGFICKRQAREGYQSVGWVFDPSLIFDFDKLVLVIDELKSQVIRIKAVMITLEGIAGVNVIDGELSIIELDDSLDSRLEMILPLDAAINEAQVQASLLNCLAIP